MSIFLSLFAAELQEPKIGKWSKELIVHCPRSLSCIFQVTNTYFNASPDDKILALSKLNAFADNFIVVKIIQFLFERV